MQLSIRRQTFMILGLAASLSAALVVIATDEELRGRLGTTYWIIGLALIGSILLVLAGYVFDRTLIARLKEISQQASAARAATDRAAPDVVSDDPDEIMGLARKIEQMARSLQKSEASYRAIVEDQADLICRYKSDGRLTFANGAYTQFLGRKRPELIGQPWAVLADGLTPWRASETWPESATFETTLTAPDGSSRVIQWTHRAIKDRDGQLLEYQAVGHDVSVRKQAEIALRDAKEAAESADRAKSEFLAIVSHELRTPINGVIGFSRLLRGTPLTAEQLGYTDTIQRCGQSLETLVSDILDLSKIEAGRLEISCSPFSLRECVDEVLRLFEEPARKANLSLVTDLSPELPAILEGDQNRLRQVLINLVGNAIKFTEKGGVTIRLGGVLGDPVPGAAEGTRAYTLRGEIIDTGVGISADELPRLFRAFSQLDTSSTRRHGGTGLGLVISKRLCELMHGGITVESTPGRGSNFRFEVLLTKVRGESLAPFPAAATAGAPQSAPANRTSGDLRLA
ncbi:MAG: ATP-binding protein [Opitutaceae bacterium]|jgi:PAS domain S-box-containing protein|nr:ATP-binding protein [Opitutaceae bacterium]